MLPSRGNIASWRAIARPISRFKDLLFGVSSTNLYREQAIEPDLPDDWQSLAVRVLVLAV